MASSKRKGNKPFEERVMEMDASELHTVYSAGNIDEDQRPIYWRIEFTIVDIERVLTEANTWRAEDVPFLARIMALVVLSPELIEGKYRNEMYRNGMSSQAGAIGFLSLTLGQEITKEELEKSVGDMEMIVNDNR